MNTARLKNIVILILALFNAFLLILLFSQQLQQRSARSRSAEQLEQLFEKSNLSLSADVLSVDGTFFEYAVGTDESAQKVFAATLLGDITQSTSAGVVRYEGQNGYCQFRGNGGIEAGFTDYAVDDPQAFCARVFQEYGYTVLSSGDTEMVSGGKSTITGTRCTEDGVIYNATLSFTFSGKKLTAISGSFLPEVTALGACEAISATTALVDFLDYYNAGGLVCTEVTRLQGGYLLQGFASAQLKLAPVWYIETDVSSYYVDCTTGEISRA